MLLYNKLNTECWIIWASTENDRGRRTEETTLSDCAGLDFTLPHKSQATSWLSGWTGGKWKAAEKSGEYWPGKALLKDSFSLTAAFSSNWISDEAQSPFANAYENVFFQLPLPTPLSRYFSLPISGSISMLKINETDRLLTQFDAPQLWRFYKYWNHLSADRQKKHRTQNPELTPNWNPNDDWLQSGEFNGTLSTVSEKNTA